MCAQCARRHKMVLKHGLRGLLIFILLLSLLAMITACGEKKSEEVQLNYLPDETTDKNLTFTVTFDSHGGTAVESVKTVSNQTIAEPARPQRTGYTFNGWFPSESYSVKWNFSQDTVTSNLTLHALWTLTNDVYVSDKAFSFSGGVCYYTVPATADTLDLTGKIVLQTENGRYAIYSDPDCHFQVGATDSAVFSLESGVNRFYLRIMNSALEEIKVVPFVISRNRIFKVSYYDNNGYWMNDVYIEEGSVIDQPERYSLTGYTVRWNRPNGSEWTFGAQGDKVTADTELHAVLDPIRCTILLDANGGEIDRTETTVSFGETPAFPVPTRRYAGFLGWYTAQGDRVSGNSGVSDVQWNYTDTVHLIAKWELTTVPVTRKCLLDDAVVSDGAETIVCGSDVFLSANREYDHVSVVGHRFILYAFDGWYIGGARVSLAREYALREITVGTEIVEKWYTVSVGVSDNEDIDQEITFSTEDSASFTTYGNVNVGEVVSITVSCGCGGHTFNGWSDTTLLAETRKLRIEGKTEKNTKWLSLCAEVSCVLDGETTEEEKLISAVTGAGLVRYNEVADFAVIPQIEYTFCGWYIDGIMQSRDFSYEYKMEQKENVAVEARWYTTDTYLTIVSDHAEGGSVRIDPIAEQNRIGGYVRLVSAVKPGYVLKGLYSGDEKAIALDRDHMTCVIPEQTTEYTAAFQENHIRIRSNIADAGAITYAVNAESTTGTTCGSDFAINGMIDGDGLRVSATAYDGYVWLGWYKDGSFLTEKAEYVLGEITAEKADEGMEMVACWKPLHYEVNISSGVYSRSNPQSITEGRYFTYENGLFTLCPAGRIEEGVAYFIFSDYNVSGGTQSVSAKESTSYPGEDITLTATVNYKYRFEGWYDDLGNLLTFDRTYTFHIKDLGRRYQAWYTAIPDVGEYAYEIATKIYPRGGFERQESLPTPSGAGSINYFAYKVIENDRCVEKCRIEVKTTKGEISENNEGESVCKGYNYNGLYEEVYGVDLETVTWMAVQMKSPVRAENGFQKDIFGYAYEMNVTRGEQKMFFAVWARTAASEYYKSADIFNENSLYGNIYYMALSGNLILVAEPNNGYSFVGWQVQTSSQSATDIIHEAVYEAGNPLANCTIKALWRPLNQNINVYAVRVKTPSGSAQGSVSATAVSDGSNDEITLSATTGDGYVFKGWFVNNVLFTNESEIKLFREKDENNSEQLKWRLPTGLKAFSYDVQTGLYAVDGKTLTELLFEPRWKKTDAVITVESVGETEIKGYLVDDNGVYRYEYCLSTALDASVKRTLDDYENDYKDSINVLLSGDYVFDGWYDADGNKLSEFLSYTVFEGDLKTYYKAVWTKSDVAVDIQNHDTDKGTVGYLFESSVLILNAVPENGYRFEGWQRKTEEGSTTESYELYFEKSITGSTKLYEYDVFFSEIPQSDKPSAELTSGATFAAATPQIIGFANQYVVTAPKMKGYIFAGWRRRGGTEIEETNMVYFYNNDAGYTMVAVYQDITSDAMLNRFSVKPGTDNFKDNITYYGYKNAQNELIVDIAVTVPNGYYFTATDVAGNRLPALNASIVRLTGEITNDVVTIDFDRISSRTQIYCKQDEQVDNILFNSKGYYKREEAGNYTERWTLSGAFGQDGYSFIGWYDKNGTLLNIEDTFDIEAVSKNEQYDIVFGKYTIELINEEPTAGKIYVQDYDVTISFDVNANKYGISTSTDEWFEKVGYTTVPAQSLNAGDVLTYPLHFVNKETANFAFGGWYDNPEGTGLSYDFSGKIKKDMTLYAKWFPMSDFGAEFADRLLSNGKETFLKTTKTESYKYFNVLSDTDYVLTIRNQNSGQRTKVVLGEAKVGGGIVAVKETYIISGETSARVTLPVERDVMYCLCISETNTDSNFTEGKNVMLKLEAADPESTAFRDNTLPYGAGVTVAVQPATFVARDNVNEWSEYVFTGWYYCNTEKEDTEKENWVLFTGEDRFTFHSGYEDKPYTIYPMLADLSYENYAVYASGENTIRLKATWREYTIHMVSSDRDGGDIRIVMTKDSVRNSETYQASGWQLTASPNFEGDYAFGGWYLYDESESVFAETPFSTASYYMLPLGDKDTSVTVKCEWVYTKGSGIRKITYQMNTAGAVNSLYNVATFTESSENPIVLYNPHKDYIDPDTNKIAGYYIFEGWYTDRNCTDKNRIYEIIPQNVTDDITVYAKWGPVVKGTRLEKDVDGSLYFYFGFYPQTKVGEEESADIVPDNTVYQESYRNTYGYNLISDKSSRYVRVGGDYYRCDQIRWNVISTENNLIYAESAVVLDVATFKTSTSSANGVYANNWEYSKLREWLNGSFLENNFLSGEKGLLALGVQTIENGSDSGNKAYTDTDQFAWAKQKDTMDTLFVASYRDKTNVANGFIDRADRADEKRVAAYTDYALMRSAGKNEGYWLRSWADKEFTAYRVTENGVISSASVTTECGVRPTIVLDARYCFEQ